MKNIVFAFVMGAILMTGIREAYLETRPSASINGHWRDRYESLHNEKEKPPKEDGGKRSEPVRGMERT